MTLRSRMRAELERSPLTVCATIVGVLVAAAGVFVAWLQLQAAPTGTGAASAARAAEPLREQIATAPAGALLVVAAFLVVSLTAASFTRLLYKVSPFTGFVASVPVASLSILFTSLVAKWSHFDPTLGSAGEALSELVFYGTITVFLLITGKPVLSDYLRFAVAVPRGGAAPSATEKDSSGSAPDGLAIAVSIPLLLAIWGGFVAGAQRLVLAAFL